MGGSLSRLLLAGALCASAACREAAPPPLVAQVTGEFEISGLTAPVRVARDRWGVPHIYAESQNDLFVAQGFVQAQDRLFQMDLWRRSAQGRLSEVFGSNFAGRDAMTRRIQYRGDPAAEWASYGADTKEIATAFVAGVNAWVAVARERPSEEFQLAGWTPDFWSAADLLNRTDAFLASGDALDEVARNDLSYVIGDAIRRVGTAPFFIGLEGSTPAPPSRASPPPAPAAVSKETEAARQRSNSLSQVSAASGVLTFTEADDGLSSPSRRYFVHLHAPAWNVIGATRPWLPGVAVGHNERVAWGMAPYAADTQDLRAEPLGAPTLTNAKDTLAILGRNEPVEFDSQFTPDGVVVTTDKERGVAYVLRWSGTQPGAAAELASLALNRARNGNEFRSALSRWKMPLRQFVYADADGHVASQVAGLIPIRIGERWQGWMTLDDLPHRAGSPGSSVHVSDAREKPAADAQASFGHVLGVNQNARARLNIGPFARPADDGPVRGALEPAGWDRSRAMNAPGQSESPASPHFADMAGLWSKGEMFPLAFSETEVRAHTASTLTLVPRRAR